jgi:hypothetical protein
MRFGMVEPSRFQTFAARLLPAEVVCRRASDLLGFVILRASSGGAKSR